MPSEHGLPPDPTTSRQSARKYEVDSRSSRTGGPSGVVGAPNLAQDFSFSEDLGIEPCGYHEEMTDRRYTIIPDQHRVRRHPPTAGQASEPRFTILLITPVVLAPITGAE